MEHYMRACGITYALSITSSFIIYYYELNWSWRKGYND